MKYETDMGKDIHSIWRPRCKIWIRSWRFCCPQIECFRLKFVFFPYITSKCKSSSQLNVQEIGGGWEGALIWNSKPAKLVGTKLKENQNFFFSLLIILIAPNGWSKSKILRYGKYFQTIQNKYNPLRKLVGASIVSRRTRKHEPVSETGVKIDDQLLFGFGEEASLKVGAEIVGPAEATALTAAAEACELGDGPPAALTIGENKIDELLVLFGRPGTLFNSKFVAARLPPHVNNDNRAAVEMAQAF